MRTRKSDISNYLKSFADSPPKTYANVLKALRVFYGGYLGRGEAVEGFKFPSLSPG